MAKYTPGPFVSAVSGSIGGTTFSRNRGGQYTRARAVPITSTTTFALAAKARLATASASWQNLTSGERDSWQFWAQANPSINTLGNSIILTGQQAYVGNHTRMSLGGFTVLTSPPIIAAPNALLSLVQDGDIGTGDVDMVYTATPLGAAEYIWQLGAVTSSAGINYVQNLLRFCGISAAAQASPFDNESILVARLGALSEGQTLHVQPRVFSSVSGLLSRPIRDRVVITDTP